MSNKENFPDVNGFFGEYGGKFVPETLMFALDELETTYNNLKDDPIMFSESLSNIKVMVFQQNVINLYRILL